MTHRPPFGKLPERRFPYAYSSHPFFFSSRSGSSFSICSAAFRRLSTSNGYLIKHNGFDKVLLRLGDMFGYRLPPEEAFICDAKIRYKKLSDAMDALIGDTSNLL